jgi:hypothetical protein
LYKTLSPDSNNRSIECNNNNKSINNNNNNSSLFYCGNNNNNKHKNKLITSLHKGILSQPTLITQNDLISNHVNSTQHEILRAMQHRHFNSNRNNRTSLLTNNHLHYQYKSAMIAHQFKSRDSIPLRIIHKSINSSNINNISIPKFDLNNYDVISQISQGRNSKVLCVKEQNTNNFFAIKKDFILKQTSKEEIIHNIYIQYICSKQSSFIININALHEGNEEISTLQELGINNYSSEIAANRKIRKVYKEIELVKLISHITEAMIVINDNGYTHFNIQ